MRNNQKSSAAFENRDLVQIYDEATVNDNHSNSSPETYFKWTGCMNAYEREKKKLTHKRGAVEHFSTSADYY